MVGISKARGAAFQILMAVERGHSHSDDLLRGKAVNELSAPDRNLATALVLGVLRWQIRMDRQIQPLLKHPNAKLDPEIRIALRMGAFQLLHMDRIPARAAIDESVELAKRAGHRFASGMVNAVLRKVSVIPRDELSEKTAEQLALSQAHPPWMVERWVAHYGLHAARAICQHGQTQPALTLRVPNPEDEAALTNAGIVLAPSELLTASRTIVSGDVAATEAFQAGRVRLQDEGSQLVAELAASPRESTSQSAQKILDACAAPGGKTIILAERHPQARIVACESSAQRLDQMRIRLAGLGDRIEFRLADAAELTQEGLFDLALTDVPCSGTGTLGRNPEIRHRLKLEDLTRQAERQSAILKAALRSIRVGGRVVYSTCSLEPEENEQVVAAALSQVPNVRLVSLANNIEALEANGILTSAGAQRLHNCLTPEGALRLMPGDFHTDGFFIAMIEKTA